jgi:hypothetical protein
MPPSRACERARRRGQRRPTCRRRVARAGGGAGARVRDGRRARAAAHRECELHVVRLLGELAPRRRLALELARKLLPRHDDARVDRRRAHQPAMAQPRRRLLVRRHARRLLGWHLVVVCEAALCLTVGAQHGHVDALQQLREAVDAAELGARLGREHLARVSHHDRQARRHRRARRLLPGGGPHVSLQHMTAAHRGQEAVGGLGGRPLVAPLALGHALKVRLAVAGKDARRGNGRPPRALHVVGGAGAPQRRGANERRLARRCWPRERWPRRRRCRDRRLWASHRLRCRR